MCLTLTPSLGRIIRLKWSCLCECVAAPIPTSVKLFFRFPGLRLRLLKASGVVCDSDGFALYPLTPPLVVCLVGADGV